MRRIKDTLRLILQCGMNQTQTAESLKISRATVQKFVIPFQKLNLTYDQILLMDDDAINAIVYPAKSSDEIPPRLPDFQKVYTDLRKRGVTRKLLWEDYIRDNPNGMKYSRFCFYYHEWQKKTNTYMHVEHVGGEKLFLDYSGMTMEVIDRNSGEIRKVEIFVSAWGASQYLYVEAQESQKKEDWLMGQARAFEYYEGVPKILVPDNLKSAVTKANRYDPDINKAYLEFSEHYGCAIVPARPRKPQDKGKVENGVLQVQRKILALLAELDFYSLAELNKAIWEKLEVLNNLPMQKIPKSRKELFDELDKPNLRSLPEKRYEYSTWKKATISPDFHVQVGHSFYSVPWREFGKEVEVKTSGNLIEIYSGTRRICSHPKLLKEYSYATVDEHLPEAQIQGRSLTVEKLKFQARKVGANTELFITKLIESRLHPVMAFRPSQGIIRLAEKYSVELLEACAITALEHKMFRVYEVENLIKLKRKTVPEDEMKTVSNTENIRGAEKFKEMLEN